MRIEFARRAMSGRARPAAGADYAPHPCSPATSARHFAPPQAQLPPAKVPLLRKFRQGPVRLGPTSRPDPRARSHQNDVVRYRVCCGERSARGSGAQGAGAACGGPIRPPAAAGASGRVAIAPTGSRRPPAPIPPQPLPRLPPAVDLPLQGPRGHLQGGPWQRPHHQGGAHARERAAPPLSSARAARHWARALPIVRQRQPPRHPATRSPRLAPTRRATCASAA